MVDQLHMLFNVLFETGKFPRNWNIGTLTPIFKKGDPYECKNYHTIMVGSILGMLYCAILEQRLQRWCEVHKKKKQKGKREAEPGIVQLTMFSYFLKLSTRQQAKEVNCLCVSWISQKPLIRYQDINYGED